MVLGMMHLLIRSRSRDLVLFCDFGLRTLKIRITISREKERVTGSWGGLDLTWRLRSFRQSERRLSVSNRWRHRYAAQ